LDDLVTSEAVVGRCFNVALALASVCLGIEVPIAFCVALAATMSTKDSDVSVTLRAMIMLAAFLTQWIESLA